MKSPSLPRLLVVPFAYPDCPSADIQRQIDHSLDWLAQCGLQVSTAPPVIATEDVPKALGVLRASDFDLLVALLVSWVEAPLFTATLKPFFSQPILLWSHTIYEEDGVGLTLGALPAAGVLRETLEEMGARFWFTYGMPGDPGVKDCVTRLARSAAAVRALSTARVGLLGYAAMGMYTGTIDHTQLRRQLGPEIDQLDQYEIVRRASTSRRKTRPYPRCRRLPAGNWEKMWGKGPAPLVAHAERHQRAVRRAPMGCPDGEVPVRTVAHLRHGALPGAIHPGR